MFTIGPGNRDHHVASRVAVGVFVPLMLLLAMHRLDLAIFASFAAFTGIYGRGQAHRKRVSIQLRAGSLMLFVILLASLFARAAQAVGLPDSAVTWLRVVATTAVAGACALVSAEWRLRPAGSLFHIFAFAAIASVPHQPPLWECLVVAVLTAAGGMAIGVSSRVVPGRRGPWTMDPHIWLTADERRIALRDAGGYVVAAGIAGTVATLVGASLGFGHNYWAMVAAVVPLVGHTTRHRLSRGIQRIVGTFLGLFILAGILLLHPTAWQLVIVIAACQFGAEMFIARQYVIAQMFVTPLALTSTLLAAPVAPEHLLRDRIVDTLIGASIGICVVVVPVVWRRARRQGTAGVGAA